MRMRSVLLAALAALVLATPTWAQSGGPVVVKAIDTATFAPTDVGDNTNHALRVNIVAGSAAGGTSLADGGTFTQATTSTTPASGLFITSYTAATTGKNAVWRMTSGGAGYTNLDTIGATAVVTGGVAGLLGVGGPVASGASNADNPVKIGGAFNTTQPTVTTGQIVDAQMTARGAQIVATGVDAFTATLGAGSAIIGAVKPVDGCGTTTYDPTPLLIADATLDVLTGTTTCLDTIVVANVGSTQETITVQDTQGTPVQMLKVVPIAPGASLVLSGLNGLKFASGIKYQASTANKLSLWARGRQ